MSQPVGARSDCPADGLGDGVSDREEGVDPALAQSADVGEERIHGACAIGAHEDIGAAAVGVGELGERVVEYLYVIACGVHSGIARTQPSRQYLADVSQEAQQGVVAEAAFVSARPPPSPRGRR